MKWWSKLTSNKAQPRNQNEAFRVLFEMFYERVYQTAFFMTRDTHLAQDVVQEAFLKAFQHIDKVLDGSKMGAWLSVITTNTAIDLLRKQNRWNGIPTDDVILMNRLDQSSDYSIEDEIMLRADLEELREHLGMLAPHYRQVLILRYHQGLKYEEIAELLETTSGTIKSKVHRAKAQLKALLQQNNGLQRETVTGKGGGSL